MTFKEIKVSDTNINSFTTNKNFILSQSSDVLFLYGKESPTFMVDTNYDLHPTNSYNGIPYDTMHKSIVQNVLNTTPSYKQENIISVGYIVIGNRIKENSIQLTNEYIGSISSAIKTVSAEFTSSINITDINKNLINLNNTSSINQPNFHVGFNYVLSESLNNQINSFETTPNAHSNISASTGIEVYQNTVTSSFGMSGLSNGDGFLLYKLNGILNNNFTLSFYFKPTSVSGIQYIFSTENIISDVSFNSNTINRISYRNSSTIPLSIYLNDDYLYIKRKTSTSISDLQVCQITTDKFYVDVVKNGNDIDVYVDGVNQLTFTDDNGYISSTYDLVLFAKDVNLNNSYSGEIDELNIWDSVLTDFQLEYLHSTNLLGENLLGHNVVGKVNYNNGILVLNHPSPIFHVPLTSSTLQLRNELNITEHEYTCRIANNEFLLSTNPSVINNHSTGELKSFVTSSSFNPYVTTIGLYDDFGNLLVVGKLGQAIQKRSDVPLNFIIRFDV